jgi:hypothetical protein
MQNAFLDGLVQCRDGSRKRLLSGSFVPTAQSLAHFTKNGSQARGVAAIPLGTSSGLTGALKRRKMICHYSKNLFCMDL